ncbi:MAG: chemotaxis protein CheC [Chloroflexi bacterium]|nr:MAG: chemotaxis protein CheC [Chloroflexota bacterium]
MVLNEHQSDALRELTNIAVGRAAAALSDLTGRRVLLEVPHTRICSITELPVTLSGLMSGEVATVHQIFTGPVAGDALLLLSHEAATTLTKLLTDEPISSKRLNVSDQEVLIEIGNIVLNACLGMFGNLLQVHISFSVPRLHLDALDTLLDSLVIGTEELRYALVVSTTFRLQDTQVGGHLIIVLGVASLEHLLSEIEALG